MLDYYFFNDQPHMFFPYSQIEVVNIPDPTGYGMVERVFQGPIDAQLRNALEYIRGNVIAEKVFKVSGQAEAIRSELLTTYRSVSFLLHRLLLIYKSYIVSTSVNLASP